MNFSFGSRGRDRDKPLCRFSLRWVGRRIHEPSSRAEFSPEWSLDHLETRYRISTTERPFVPAFPRAFLRDAIEQWRDEDHVQLLTLDPDVIGSVSPIASRVPLSINGSDPTEPVHLDQFYFRNGGKLSNELKKSREEQRFSLRKIIINWLKLIRNSYSFFPIRWTREGNRRAGKFLRKSSSVT